MDSTIPLPKPIESLYGTEYCIPKPLSNCVTKGEIKTEMILDQTQDDPNKKVEMQNNKSDSYKKSKSYIPPATPTDRSYGAIRFTPRNLIMDKSYK